MDIEEQIKQLNEFYGKEELHEELKKYIFEADFIGQVLQHPLVYQVPYSPQFNKMVNKQFEFKKNKLEQAIENKDWDNYIFMHERPYRIEAFQAIEENLSNKEYWSTLKSIFVDSENIYQNFNDWENLFYSERDCKEYFMSEDNKLAFDELPEELIIYRGFVNDDGENSFSWSLDIEKAIWFANRFSKGEEYYVAKATVNKKDIIGYTNDRNEEEIVVLPEHLNILKVVNSNNIDLLHTDIKKTIFLLKSKPNNHSIKKPT
jgi:hypothetical protein